jgi:carbamoyl-phosphate synthase/aspartate carbamoyltransferase
VAALVVASYAGEEYSHYLAKSSLGTWLKEQGVPAIYGVDTRLLTKKIRETGSLLGRLMMQKSSSISGKISGAVHSLVGKTENWRDAFENVEWDDPNKRNLVAEGNPSPNIFCLTSETKLNQCPFGNRRFTLLRPTLRSSGPMVPMLVFFALMSV